jgi:NMT1/THI5 like
MDIIRYFSILLFFFCFGFSNTPLSAAENPETVTLQLKWFHQYQFAGYYAAKEKGFYTEEGLNVILNEQTKGEFENGLASYYARKFSQASVSFDRVLEQDPEDKAARIYLKRCAHHMVNGVPDEWTGIEVLNRK